MLLCDTRISIKDFDPLEEHVKSNVEPWRKRFISKSSKSMHIDCCLSSTPMYMSRFFWQATNGHKRTMW